MEGKHQPIVTKEEFERVQKMMAEKDAQMGQRRKNKGVHSDEGDWMMPVPPFISL